jgi:predicted  nucleic acid-binding Zn-ribbon protein
MAVRWAASWAMPSRHNAAHLVGWLNDKGRPWNTDAHVLPALASLKALQRLDTAADAARKRLGEMPAAEHTIEAGLATATGALDAVKARIQENQAGRRALEKEVAAVDTRLARFDDHRAAIKTNHEYQALLHEISTAKTEKNTIEDKIIVFMEEAETLAADLKAAEAALAAAKREGDQARAALTREKKALSEEVSRLTHDRGQEARGVDAGLLTRYDQLLKQRRGVAVAAMIGEMCSACHVRQRPHVAQQIRRNDSIFTCESCQRILYFDDAKAEA